jgi:hypothetical protein
VGDSALTIGGATVAGDGCRTTGLGTRVERFTVWSTGAGTRWVATGLGAECSQGSGIGGSWAAMKRPQAKEAFDAPLPGVVGGMSMNSIVTMTQIIAFFND